MSQGWVSELVTDLSEHHLVEKGRTVEYADTYEARLFARLSEKYDVGTLLAGKKEEILRELHRSTATVTTLEKRGFPASTTYSALGDLRTVGAVAKGENGAYRIADETLQEFLKATTSGTTQPEAREYRAENETLVVTQDGDTDGTPTAFSAFQRYGVEYYPARDYRYQGETDPDIEDVLVHAVRAAETRKQASMAAVFYLKHRSILDVSEVWNLADTWDCVEEWADTLAYADQRDVKQEDRFLPREEFTSLAQDYDVFLRGYHPEESLSNGLQQLGAELETAVDAYLVGGGNLILRELKDSTKDLDIVVDSNETLLTLGEAVRALGYEERTDLEKAYEELDPAVVFEKDGAPRYDIFVTTVAGKLELTEQMKRADRTYDYGNLQLHLVSLTDIFLFKSVTEREGDLEDAALVTRRTSIDWESLFDEIRRQEELTGQYFSFAVLDTMDVLKEREGIDPPIHRRLVSYCLENALLVSLENPKTIEDLRAELDFPDHQIYNKLRKLEDENEIVVDRTGTLNEYRVREPGDSQR